MARTHGWRVLGGMVAAVMALAGLAASTASGHVTLDLRLAGGGNTVEMTSATQTVDLQLWATVQGNNSILTDDGLWKFYTSIRSSNGGLLFGDIGKKGKSGWHLMWGTTVTPFGTGQAAYTGSPTDLDGDGDLDIGSNNPADANFWMLARAGTPQATVPSVNDSPQPNQWYIADYRFTGKAWGPEDHGVTRVFLTPRADDNSIWNEDGYIGDGYLPFDMELDWKPDTTIHGAPIAGQQIILYTRAQAADPGAGQPVVVGFEDGLTLDAGSSTGSINTYRWDLDGDGDWDLTGGNPVTVLSWDDLMALGLAPGAQYAARLGVAWIENPTITEGETTFTLQVMPEPATLALVAAGCLAALLRRTVRR